MKWGQKLIIWKCFHLHISPEGKVEIATNRYIHRSDKNIKFSIILLVHCLSQHVFCPSSYEGENNIKLINCLHFRYDKTLVDGVN